MPPQSRADSWVSPGQALVSGIHESAVEEYDHEVGQNIERKGEDNVADA